MISDDDLVQAMAMGDQAAFEAFVHRYHGPLYGYLERMLQQRSTAEDMVQELFIRLIRQLQTGGPPRQIRAWMYRVASNLCRDYWRSASYRKEQQMADPPDRKDVSASVTDFYERQETRKEILEQLNRLSDIQRTVVILRFYQDLRLKDIAEILEIPLSTAKTHLYTAMNRLKKGFDQTGRRDYGVYAGRGGEIG